MPLVVCLLIVLMVLGLGLYAGTNAKVAEVGRIVFFCALFVFLAVAVEHLQLELVKRR